MKRLLTITLASVLALSMTGCFGFGRGRPRIPAQAANEYGASTLPAAPIVTQTDRAMAASARELPAAGYMPPQDRPIYNNPKIAKVVLAPHIDKSGRLYGAQEMYQVADEGGWNIEALEPGASGYIPSVNVETPANVGNPIAAPARRSPPVPAESKHLVDQIDAENVVMTGLLNQTDEPQAKVMAKEKGMVAVWDEQLGWLLIPAQN